MTKRPFVVIEGERPPETALERVRTRVKAAPKPAEMLQCPRCGGRALLETKIGVMVRKTGKPFGGTTELICAGPCLFNGERVVVR